MLVLSRMRGKSIIVSDSDGELVLTVLQVRCGEVALLVKHTSADKLGALNTSTSTLVRDASLKVQRTTWVTLVEIRGEKAIIGIDASKSARVYRLEMWEAIGRRRPSSGDKGDDGLSASPVPPPSGPKPPSLDVRLDEPPESDGGV